MHLQGTMRLESALGKGTRLTVELPARPRLATIADTDAHQEPGLRSMAGLNG
jgi:hypothetical protein